MKPLRILYLALAIFALLSLVACGSEGDEASGGEAPCQSNSDCTGGMVCVSFGSGAGVCTPTCSVSGDECSGTAGCSGVGTLSVSVCQETSTDGEAPAPEEQPRVPCTTDAECAAIQPGIICAEFEGVRDCTIPCTVEGDCDLPSVGGMSVDFMTCIADERSDQTRTACLPDKACFTNPMTCIDMGALPPGDPGEIDDDFGSGSGGFGFGGGGDPADF